MPKESQQIKITRYHERSHATQQDVEQDLYNLGLLSRYACRARWPDWGRMPLLDIIIYVCFVSHLATRYMNARISALECVHAYSTYVHACSLPFFWIGKRMRDSADKAEWP